MSTKPQTTTLKLNTGAELPLVGLGVFQAPRGETTRFAVGKALEIGYRHVDTARIYRNEEDVGAAIRASAVAREDVFVTTKLWNEDHGRDKALRAFDASLARLGLEYVDLYLVHWPVPSLRLDTWRAFETIHASGRARAIGVSNYMVNHLEELLAHAKTPPAVNQIEVSPFLQQRDVRALCARENIVVEAYSPLTQGVKLANPVVARVAEETGKTPAQVLLRWGLDGGMVVLPKSTNEARIRENFGVFDFTLSDSQRARLDGLEESFTTGWDPRGAP